MPSRLRPQVSNATVATIDAQTGKLGGKLLGMTEVFVEDKRIAGGGDSAVVYVVNAHKLQLQVCLTKANATHHSDVGSL